MASASRGKGLILNLPDEQQDPVLAESPMRYDGHDSLDSSQASWQGQHNAPPVGPRDMLGALATQRASNLEEPNTRDHEATEMCLNGIMELSHLCARHLQVIIIIKLVLHA